jgi:uncharacterized membrane protein
MRSMYTKFYQMSRSEMFAAFAITIAVVVAYSFWGSIVIKSQASTPFAPVATIDK